MEIWQRICQMSARITVAQNFQKITRGLLSADCMADYNFQIKKMVQICLWKIFLWLTIIKLNLKNCNVILGEKNNTFWHFNGNWMHRKRCLNIWIIEQLIYPKSLYHLLFHRILYTGVLTINNINIKPFFLGVYCNEHNWN